MCYCRDNEKGPSLDCSGEGTRGFSRRDELKEVANVESRVLRDRGASNDAPVHERQRDWSVSNQPFKGDGLLTQLSTDGRSHLAGKPRPPTRRDPKEFGDRYAPF